MDDMLRDIGAIIGYALIALTGGTGIAYWLFKQLSEKWLNAEFSERLEAFKHQQAKGLEQLQFDINALMDRTIRLHQNEFEVLPNLWSKLILAHAYIDGVTSRLQRYSDRSRMDDDQLEEFLSTSSLSVGECRELKEAHDKNEYFQRIENFKRSGKARAIYVKFHSYLRRKGIFVQPEIKDRFEKFSELFHGALIEHELRLEHPDF